MKPCPFCCEEIQESAIKCRHCGSWIEQKRWHRNHPERRLLGVCAAIAYQFHLPVTLFRLAFVLVGLANPALIIAFYLLLWFFIPNQEGGRAAINVLQEKVREIWKNFIHDHLHENHFVSSNGSNATSDKDS